MYLPENREQSTLIASVISGRDSKELLTKESLLEIDAKITKVIHPKFEKCFKVVPEHSGVVYLKVEFKSDINGVRIFQKVYSNRNFLRENNHPNLINEVDYSIEHVKKLCFDDWFIYKFYEFPYTDLRTLTKKRLNRKNPAPILSTKDLNILLKEQSLALAHLHKKGKFHGSLKPSDIAITKQGRSKLWATSCVDTSKKYIYKQKNLLMNKGKIYQSPHMFNNLRAKNTIFKINPAKEDAFALGLILMEAGTGLSCQELYVKKKTFNLERLKHMLTVFEFSHRSDPNLVQKVKGLCETDSNLRNEVISLTFEQATQPVEPNTNNTSLNQTGPGSDFFYNESEDVRVHKNSQQSYFGHEEERVKQAQVATPYFSPNQSNRLRFQDSRNKWNRNFSPSQTGEFFSSNYSQNNNNFSFKNKKRTFQIDPVHAHNQYPNSRNHTNNYSVFKKNYAQGRPYSPSIQHGRPQTSRSVPNRGGSMYDSNRYDGSQRHNHFQTFGQNNNLKDLIKNKPGTVLQMRPAPTKSHFQNRVQPIPEQPQQKIKIYRANGNRDVYSRLNENPNSKQSSEEMFKKHNFKSESREKAAPIYKPAPVNPSQGKPFVYKGPSRLQSNNYLQRDSRAQSTSAPKQRRYHSANITAKPAPQKSKFTYYKNHKFGAITNIPPIREVPSNQISQTVSVSKTSSSNVDTFPIMQIGQPMAQSPIDVDRDVSLKPRKRPQLLTLNKNTLLSQTPVLSPGTKKYGETVKKEQYDIDAEEFLAQQRELGNYNSGINSKFNLLSQNFDDNYATNKDLASHDNSIHVEGNGYFNGSPKDFDENFKLDADELFSQRLNNSNEMPAKQFNFEEEKRFRYKFDQLTDNSGSQDSYMRVKSEWERKG